MHLDHDHISGGAHEHTHTHADGTVHTHVHTHEGAHVHTHPHEHTHTHSDGTVHTHPHTHEGEHTHSHDCDQNCGSCEAHCEHTPMEELMALMKYMVGHNAAHAKELAELAAKLEEAGNHVAYEQVMAAVSDFEKGNMRLSVVLQSMAE